MHTTTPTTQPCWLYGDHSYSPWKRIDYDSPSTGITPDISEETQAGYRLAILRQCIPDTPILHCVQLSPALEMGLQDIHPHTKVQQFFSHRIVFTFILQLKFSASTPQRDNTMSISAIQGPGILFVRSRISPSANEILSEPTFLAWYDNEHIPEVVSTSGVDSAFRFIDIHKSAPIGNEQNPKPFLACYPMEDLAFTLGDEFKNIGFRSSALPGSGVIYDLADMDVSYLGIVGKTPKREEGEGGRPKYVITSGIRPEKQPAEGQVTAFFKKVCSFCATHTECFEGGSILILMF